MGGRVEIFILVLCYAATQTRSQVTAKRQHIRLPVVTPFFPLDAPQYNPVAASNQQHTLRPYVPGIRDGEDQQTPIQHPFQRNTTDVPPLTEVVPDVPVPKPFGPFQSEDIPTTKPVLKTNLPDGKLPHPLKVQGPNGSPVNNSGNIDDQYPLPVTQDRPAEDADSIIFPNVTEEDVSLEEPQVTQRVSNDTVGNSDNNNTPSSATGTANDRWVTKETPTPVAQVPVGTNVNIVPLQPTPTVINQGSIPFIITNLNPSTDTLKNVAPLTPIQILSNTVPLQVPNAPTNPIQYNALCVPSSSTGNVANINGNLYAVLTVPNGNSNLVPCTTFSNGYQNNQNVQLVSQYPNNQISQGSYYAVANPGLGNNQVNAIPTYGVRNGVDSSSSVQGSVPVYVQNQPTATSSPQYIVLNG